MEKKKTKGYRKPTYKKLVERILREYPILKKSIDEVEPYLYPSCTTIYEERIGHAYREYTSSTEKYGIRKAEKKIQVAQIEKALEVLSSDELKLVEARYFYINVLSDSLVYDRLGWSKRNYYRIKSQAICKIALALNLI
jgi:ArpU family phage transcriptional regulator